MKLNGYSVYELKRALLNTDLPMHLRYDAKDRIIRTLVAAGLAVEHGRPGDDSDCGCGFYRLTGGGVAVAERALTGERVTV